MKIEKKVVNVFPLDACESRGDVLAAADMLWMEMDDYGDIGRLFAERNQNFAEVIMSRRDISIEMKFFDECIARVPGSWTIWDLKEGVEDS